MDSTEAAELKALLEALQSRLEEAAADTQKRLKAIEVDVDRIKNDVAFMKRQR